VACAYSTLGYEALARDSKVAFFSPDISRYEKSYNFGWPNSFDKKGFFYSNKYNYNEVNRVLTNLIGMKDKEWCKKIRNYRDKVMLYDKGNKKLLKSIQKMIR
jgi:surface carbohydrate biosynthesis protein